MFSKLPSSLDVREVANQGNGIFTKTFIPKGKEIIRNMPYSFGAGGVTVEDVRGSCHHCLKIVRDKTTSVVCSSCKVVGYCSKACLDSAAPLHSMECKGLSELEQYRGKVTEFTSRVDGYLYWPPKQVLKIARAINRRVLNGGNKHDDKWLKYLSRHNLSPAIANQYPLFKRFVRYLVPSHVTDDEIYRMYIVVCVNSADVVCPPGTSAGALYFAEFSLLNHMCQPNCEFENDVTEVSVYAIQDIQPGSQLCISYLNSRERITWREIRRKSLKESFGFDCNCLVCMNEETIGSKFWLMDQQKRSLIAPWSREFADRIMNRGWEAIRTCESMEPLPSIKVLETSLAVQTSILDKRNILFILTIRHIMINYHILHDYKRGIEHLRSLGIEGMTAFFEYGTVKDIDEIILLVLRSCSEFGLNNQGTELDKLFHNYFPKAPSTETLCMALGRELPPSMVKHLQEKYFAEPKPHIELCDVVCSILNICNLVLKQ